MKNGITYATYPNHETIDGNLIVATSGDTEITQYSKSDIVNISSVASGVDTLSVNGLGELEELRDFITAVLNKKQKENYLALEKDFEQYRKTAVKGA